MPATLVLPRQVAIISGAVAPGAVLRFYRTGTSTPQSAYTDSALTNAVTSLTADAAGVFAKVYLNPNAAADYRVTLENSAAVVSYTEDDISKDGLPRYDTTPSETAAGFTASELSRGYEPGDVRRYLIAPNDTAKRTANTTALKKLISAVGTSTYKGRLSFPNTTGSDTYYFNDVVEVKDGVYVDLNGCTIDFAKTYAAADDTMGFFTFIRDVTIENGTIKINYNGTGGTNAGNGIRIGSRVGYRFGTFTSGIEEEDLTTPMGNIALRNLKVVTNNPVAAPILMLGGIDGLVTENLIIDGQNAATLGFYYEFGFWHKEATAANIKSAHARNLNFINTTVKSLATTSGSCFELVGAMSAKVSGLHMDTGFSGLIIRSGEALFYNVGAPDVNLKPHIVLESINGKGLASTGISLQGAEAAAGGYLSTVIGALAAGPKAAAQTDLISFSLDGFSINAGGFGLLVSGPCTIRNGSLHGAASSGQLVITDECVRFDIDNVRVVGSSSVGVRGNFGAAIWSPARLKIGGIRNGHVAGNTGSGVVIGNSQSVLIENCRIGYSTLYDPAAEATQTIGVNVQSTASGVVCRGNYITTSAGAIAYSSIGTGDRGCAVENARGTRTTTGRWKIDGIVHVSASQLGGAADAINTTDKYVGKLVVENSNNRLYFATGTGATDAWRLADGSASVTPV